MFAIELHFQQCFEVRERAKEKQEKKWAQISLRYSRCLSYEQLVHLSFSYVLNEPNFFSPFLFALQLHWEGDAWLLFQWANFRLKSQIVCRFSVIGYAHYSKATFVECKERVCVWQHRELALGQVCGIYCGEKSWPLSSGWTKIV